MVSKRCCYPPETVRSSTDTVSDALREAWLYGRAPVADRRSRALGRLIGLTFLAGLVLVGLVHPVVVLVVLLSVPVFVILIRYPVAVLVAGLFLIPFHVAIFNAINYRGHIATGALDNWKDALIVALFLRAIVGRVRAEGRVRLPRSKTDLFVLVYIVGYMCIAALSPAVPSRVIALGRIIEGPMLFLATRYLRPTRKQLNACLGAMLAAATIMAVTALIERFGPQAKLLVWYGASKPTANSAFYVGRSYRAGSFLNSPLILGFYLAGAVSLAASTIIASRGVGRFLACVAVAATGAGLVVTVTRSAYIGGGIGLLLVILLGVRNPGVRFALAGIFLVAAGGMAGVLVAKNSQTFLRPSGTDPHREALDRDLQLFAEKPMGYGIGTTDAVAQRFKLKTLKGTPIVTESTVMAKAIEGGIGGLFLYLTANFVLLFRLRRARLAALVRGDRRAAALAAGGLGTVVAIFVSGFFLGISELVVELMLWGAASLTLLYCEQPATVRPSGA